MKLRIKGNSVRLRLSQQEVSDFAREGRVADHTAFGHNRLTYSLEESNLRSIAASYKGDKITVFVPTQIKQRWTNTDQVGFDAMVDFGNEQLEILVEKDFQCLIPREEDESDLYANPRAENT